MIDIESTEYEKQIIEIIVNCREKLDMGYRRISKELEARGFKKISKDTVRNKYLIYAAANGKTNTDLSDKEFKVLKKREARQFNKTEIAKQKSQTRLRIANLKVEEVMLDIQKREILFEDDLRLLEFVEKTVAITHPTVWFIFRKLCENEGYDIVNAVWQAAGTQETFEKQTSEQKITLDEYLANCFQDWIDTWNQTKRNKEQMIEPRSNDNGYTDANGDYIIPIY